MFNVSEVARRLGVSPASVRNYGRQFAEHLSAEATPPPGETRQYSEDDMRVMATAKGLLREGFTYIQVQERLSQGIHLVETVEAPPPEPEEVTPRTDMALAIRAYTEERDRLLGERERLLQEVRELRQHVGYLEGQLEVLRGPQRKSWLQRLLGR